MVRVPHLGPIGTQEETIMPGPVVAIGRGKRRSGFGPARCLQGVSAAVVGEQAERVGRGTAPGGRKGKPGSAAVVEGVGAFVDSGRLAGDGVGHFPLLCR